MTSLYSFKEKKTNTYFTSVHNVGLTLWKWNC